MDILSLKNLIKESATSSDVEYSQGMLVFKSRSIEDDQVDAIATALIENGYDQNPDLQAYNNLLSKYINLVNIVNRLAVTDVSDLELENRSLKNEIARLCKLKTVATEKQLHKMFDSFVESLDDTRNYSKEELIKEFYKNVSISGIV